MKISDGILQHQIQDILRERRHALADLQISLASGLKHPRRSDHPAETAAASVLQRASASNQQWQSNVDHALSWTRVTEGYLTQVVDRLHRADELAVQAGDASANAADRAGIAAEVDSILEQLLSLSSARHQGAYLFAGTHSDQPPMQVTRDASGAVTAVSPRTADVPLRAVQVDDDTVWSYGTAAAGDNGLFVDAASGTDVFQTLVDLRDALLAGSALPSGVKQNLETARDHAVARLVSTGMAQRRFESLDARHSRTEEELTLRLSELAEVDLARAVTELGQLEATLQASLQIAARMKQLKLSDFI